VRSLMAGVRRAEAGDLTVQVPLCGRDELMELASSFNVMTGNLDRAMKDIRNKNTGLAMVYSVGERLTKTIDLRELEEISLQSLMDVLDADRGLLLSNMAPHESEEILFRTRGDRRLHRASQIEGIGESSFVKEFSRLHLLLIEHLFWSHRAPRSSDASRKTVPRRAQTGRCHESCLLQKFAPVFHI